MNQRRLPVFLRTIRVNGRRFVWPGLMAVATCFLSHCVSSEGGYKEAMRLARTDCQRDEIVGVWELRGNADGGSQILLFSPDGTGRDRIKTRSHMVEERAFTWRYQGLGIWAAEETGAAFAAPGAAPTKPNRKGWRVAYTLRLSGDCLLCEIKPDEERGSEDSFSEEFARFMVGDVGAAIARNASRGATLQRVFVRPHRQEMADAEGVRSSLSAPDGLTTDMAGETGGAD